ncbi:hypothetical protein FEF65_06855 [Mariprofundus erugo]|uniref:Addiction module protein n=1 Tax=Mariprofundus erugo TaxID=2528639 RepID=A0A5R9GML9_9PROT|nr:addiction module protein [Mariprofundus erugo]TLS67626.1 hypothetical protein FEF65_06855 [Mariprofundus erugo]
MAVPANLLKDALALEATSRAELVDELLASLDQPDKAIDARWAEEAERRLDAYERGEMESVSVHEVLARYKTE